MVNAAELLARVKQRKQELAAQQNKDEASWEWWDNKPSAKIYHPEHVKQRARVPLQLYLTKKERARHRRIAAHKAREDARERIKLGIECPPEPKLRLKNAAAVFGAAYVQDPTRSELLAKEAEDERRRRHLEENEARHLAAQEGKYEKHAAKIAGHCEEGLQCLALVFRERLDNKSQFIIDYTAKKFGSTGVALLSDHDALVVVETGLPEAEKFERLAIAKLGASLAWKGPLIDNNFQRWSVHTLPDRLKFLKLHRVETMFDMLDN